MAFHDGRIHLDAGPDDEVAKRSVFEHPAALSGTVALRAADRVVDLDGDG